jgi:hypothetical protein
VPFDKVFAALGWTYAGKDRRSGHTYWVRPGNDPRDHSGATVYADPPARTVVYTDAAGIPADKVGKRIYNPRDLASAFGKDEAWLNDVLGVADDDGAGKSGAGGESWSGPRLLVIGADEVVPKRADWLWRYWLVRGEVHLLTGRQFGGKSLWVVHLVAGFTNGVGLPDGAECSPMICGWLSGEESVETVAARLQVAGADRSKVKLLPGVEDKSKSGDIYERPWRLPGDCALLEQRIEKSELKLVVVDGLGYMVDGDTNSYGVIGSAMSALGKVAQRTGCAILGLTHPPKGGADPYTAPIGSTAWSAVARNTWLLGLDPEDPLPDENPDKRRVVRVGATNYRPPTHGFSFKIAQDVWLETGHVVDVKESEVRPIDITSPPDREEQSEQAEIAELLWAMTEKGPILWKDAKAALREAGYGDASDKTIRRAARRAGLVTTKPEGFGGTRKLARKDQL